VLVLHQRQAVVDFVQSSSQAGDGEGLVVDAGRNLLETTGEHRYRAVARLLRERLLPLPPIFVGCGAVEGRFVRLDGVIEVVLEDAFWGLWVPLVVEGFDLLYDGLLSYVALDCVA